MRSFCNVLLALALSSSVCHAAALVDGKVVVDQDAAYQIGGITDDPTGFPTNRAESTISFTNASRTFAITPAATTYSYYIQGIKYDQTAVQTLTFPDVEGLHYAYFDGATLKCTNAWKIELLYEYAFVAEFYWDSTNNVVNFVGDERHGYRMDWVTHYYEHSTAGAQFGSGLGLTAFDVDANGAADSNATFQVLSGSIFDEDNKHNSAAGADPSIIPLFYRLNDGDWRMSQDDAPLITNGTGRLAYNQLSGGEWSLTEVGNNQFMLVHLWATHSTSNMKAVAIMGQTTYGNVAAARSGASDEISSIVTAGLPGDEFVPIGSVIYQTSDSYGNTWQARVRSDGDGNNYVDFRQATLVPGQGPGDHGNLSGLTDDDHQQYLPADGSRPATGTQNGGQQASTNWASMDVGVINASTVNANIVGSAYVGATSGAFTSHTAGTYTASSGASISEYSTDGNLAGDSDTAVPTEQAVRTFASDAANLTNRQFDLAFNGLVTNAVDNITFIGFATVGDWSVTQCWARIDAGTCEIDFIERTTNTTAFVTNLTMDVVTGGGSSNVAFTVENGNALYIKCNTANGSNFWGQVSGRH